MFSQTHGAGLFNVQVWMDGRMDGWLGGWVSGWVDGWMEGWTDGRMDGCLYEWLHLCTLCIHIHMLMHTYIVKIDSIHVCVYIYTHTSVHIY